jgi:hypothetical protein
MFVTRSRRRKTKKTKKKTKEKMKTKNTKEKKQEKGEAKEEEDKDGKIYDGKLSTSPGPQRRVYNFSQQWKMTKSNFLDRKLGDM